MGSYSVIEDILAASLHFLGGTCGKALQPAGQAVKGAAVSVPGS